MIHILLHGVTICGVFCPNLPEGDKWVRQLHELQSVDPEMQCTQCLEGELRAANLVAAQDKAQGENYD